MPFTKLRRVRWEWWKASLLPAAALTVHQLRYWLAYGPNATRELAVQGHSYLDSLTPWIVLSLALGCGGFLFLVARAWEGRATSNGRAPGVVRLWMFASVLLIGIYSMQEFLEGLLAAGHPSGLPGIFGDGGLWALPAAVMVGGVVALLMRGAHAAIRLAARLGQRRRRPSAHTDRPVPLVAAIVPALAPMAAALATRAPPHPTA